MPSYTTPGVYYEYVDASAPSISPIRSDIAGFVGIAAHGPLNTAVPVESWRQFQAHFGGFIGGGFLSYVVRGYFENGGRRCWVVRVASRESVGTASVTLKNANKKEAWRIVASSPGVWGNAISIEVRETKRLQTQTVPSGAQANFSRVLSIAGFVRGTLVRLSQDQLTELKVISDIDPVEKDLVWVHRKPEMRLPYDEPLVNFNLNKPIFIESVEYTLIVKASGRLVVIYEGLSSIPEHEKYGPLVLRGYTDYNSPETSGRIPSAPDPVAIKELRLVEERATSPVVSLECLEPISACPTTKLTGGADGLSLLTASDFTGDDTAPDSEAEKDNKRGIRALEDIGEIAIVAVPDINIQPVAVPEHLPRLREKPDPCLQNTEEPEACGSWQRAQELPPTFTETDIYQVQSALIRHCEKHGDRVALLDPPFTTLKSDLGFSSIQAWRSRFDSKYAALYYPWLRVNDPLNPSSLTRDIPPSGHVVGQWARSDFEFGVHKAPANSPLEWVQDVTATVDDSVCGILNPAGINVIRAFPGRGIRIFGARTISSDPDWRYLNVRRLMIMIEKAIDISTQWAAFEPNDVFTRSKICISLTSFLVALWQQGALVGETPGEAFFVKCNEENNPDSERDRGRLIADIGVAPSKPFEFIVLRLGRIGNNFELTEMDI
jgi:phage tail sheath protein FI